MAKIVKIDGFAPIKVELIEDYSVTDSVKFLRIKGKSLQERYYVDVEEGQEKWKNEIVEKDIDIVVNPGRIQYIVEE